MCLCTTEYSFDRMHGDRVTNSNAEEEGDIDDSNEDTTN